MKAQTPTIKIGTFVFDKQTKQRGVVIRTEIHDRLKEKNYVVKLSSGFVRNCFIEELRLLPCQKTLETIN